MLLQELIARVPVVSSNVPSDAAITAITDDNRKITAGCLFVCIAGNHFDGHDAAAAALQAGAAAVVTERALGLPAEIRVENTRAAYALLCAAWFGNPADSLTLIGVTGTNGKTTSCFLMYDLLTRMGVRCGLLGTVKNCIAGEDVPATLTTPDAFELHGLFRRMADAGCTHCLMEASSQALAQRRLEGVHFRAAIFTNLTQDHLDYHGSFEQYMRAKRMLFLQSNLAVVNADDAAASQIVQGVACPIVTFSARSDTADYTARDARMHPASVSYTLTGAGQSGEVRFGVPGGFSVYNSMGVIACLNRIGFPFEALLRHVAQFGSVPGRMEIVPTDTPYTVVIDYAHTPDALENVLRSLRETATGRIFAVFGCGGDRDRTKRPIMGGIAAANADVVIVTSDNPRTEDPEAILDDIMAGIDHPACTVLRICDRKKAIAEAMHTAGAGDVILLAGKGQETYQIIGHEKHHLDEREVVADVLSGSEQ